LAKSRNRVLKTDTASSTVVNTKQRDNTARYFTHMKHNSCVTPNSTVSFVHVTKTHQGAQMLKNELCHSLSCISARSLVYEIRYLQEDEWYSRHFPLKKGRKYFSKSDSYYSQSPTAI